MKFGSPENLPLLWGVLLLALVVVLARARLRRARDGFARPDLWPILAAGRSLVRQRVKIALRLGTAALVILALAEPQWGARIESVRRRGVDVVVLLDTSLSMAARDVTPSRLGRAKMEVASFLDKLRGDRVALVLFAGSAYLSCPLTLDYGAARMLLETAGTGSTPLPGTALGEAIDRGVRVFERKERKYKVMILLTDGEDHEGRVQEAGERAAREGVVIHVVGFGSPAGELIPLAASEAGQTGFKKDAGGTLVMTRLKEDLLRGLAKTTGGTYRRASPGGGELEAILGVMGGMEKKEHEGRSYVRYQARFQVPLVLAVVLLVADMALGERGGSRRRRSSGAARGCVVMLLSLSAALLGWGDRVLEKSRQAEKQYRRGNMDAALELYEEARSARPEMSELDYDVGVVRYRMQDWGGAGREFTEVLRDAGRSLQASGSYNLGNSLFQQGDYVGAAKAYRRALEIGPDDQDAKYNLELALRKLQEAPSPQNPQGSPQSGQEGQKDQTGAGNEQDQSQAGENQQGEDQPKDSRQAEQERQRQAENEGEERSRAGEASRGEAERDKDEVALGREDQMSPQDAERLLDALRAEEGRIMLEEQRKRARQVGGSSRDW